MSFEVSIAGLNVEVCGMMCEGCDLDLMFEVGAILLDALTTITFAIVLRHACVGEKGRVERGERRAESKKGRAESGEQRGESGEQRTKSRERRAKSKERRERE